MSKFDALRHYRSLTKIERITYQPPKGSTGAPRVRELQKLAKQLAENNPESCINNFVTRELQKTAGSNQRSYPKNALIPLSIDHISVARNRAHSAYRRKQNWLSPEPSVNLVLMTETPINYQGKFKRFTGSEYTPKLQSCGRISPDRSVLGALIDAQQYALIAPRGYFWDIDQNGIRIVRSRDGADYHPDSSDVVAGIKRCQHRLISLAETRRKKAVEVKAQARVTKSYDLILRKIGIVCTFKDSIRAGNCRAGTEAYCIRHGIPLQACIPADKLPRDSERVERVIAEAKRRTIIELQRGYAEI